MADATATVILDTDDVIAEVPPTLFGGFVEHLGEESARLFFRAAVQIGADPATWTRSQFVRLPDGCRDKGQGVKRQTVFYLNPQPLTKNKAYEYTDTNIGRS